MAAEISRSLAQQIVDTVSDVCGMSVNFINPDGRIFASSSPERIGTFHEAGREAARLQKTVEVSDDDTWPGALEGINIPVFHHQQAVAVVGITGDPAEAGKYAHLAERIARLLIAEQELGELHRTTDDKKNYLIQCLTAGALDNRDFILSCMDEFHLPRDVSYRVILVDVNTRYNLLNMSLLEQRVQTLFSSLEQALEIYSYPSRFIGILAEPAWKQRSYMVRKFAENHKELLKVAVGPAAMPGRLSESKEGAETAMDSIKEKKDSLAVFDDLTLEILLAGMEDGKRKSFLSRTVENLAEKDLEFLEVYYEEEMSLQKTAERLYLHKNTVQQRLCRIRDLTGFDPRKFTDAVLFYLACCLRK